MNKINRIIIFLTILLFFGCTQEKKNPYKNMALIPGGDFLRGSNSEEKLNIFNNYTGTCDTSWFKDEHPEHKVLIDSFYFDIYEVTNAEFFDFLNATKYTPEGNSEKTYALLESKDKDQYPVVGVSWNDAYQYCKWKGKRLPTEAEWEYVASGIEKNLIYPWGMEYDSTKANIQNRGGPKRVGSYKPNSYGIYDLGGNALEWCNDYYDENYYKKLNYNNPKGPDIGKYRVARGGTWYLNGPYYARSANRHRYGTDPKYRKIVGIRCACSIK